MKLNSGEYARERIDDGVTSKVANTRYRQSQIANASSSVLNEKDTQMLCSDALQLSSSDQFSWIAGPGRSAPLNPDEPLHIYTLLV